ncbi:Glyoxylase, beta-lactamase superfamily II [Kytococcus aerolatus]|uniref:Glyoxylase, beta-lactamase superfamily II n=1 Tax=Kytococcus aerolatus TaxID=592308 RepID=A0A212U614_9MICO|nr:MBL fold metallo-hydrolase [Kytococcus aerolatus]SNC73590.1 Glyoxylase, beta-lactamase superfamily II [Kytococcus aerolatus]
MLIADLPTVTVHRASVSEMDNRCYVITHRETGGQVLVDAADDAPALRVLLREAAGPAEPTPAGIITTHRHWDHVRALAELAGELPAGGRLLAGARDAVAVAEQAGLPEGSVEGLEHGQEVELGGITLEVVALRGHTPGSVALVLEDGGETHLFTGDSLFPGGVGKTQTPEDFQQLLADVTERLFDRFDDAAHVHPGHGEPTTLGAERPQLGEWAARGW